MNKIERNILNEKLNLLTNDYVIIKRLITSENYRAGYDVGLLLSDIKRNTHYFIVSRYCPQSIEATSIPFELQSISISDTEKNYYNCKLKKVNVNNQLVIYSLDVDIYEIKNYDIENLEKVLKVDSFDPFEKNSRMEVVVWSWKFS